MKKRYLLAIFSGIFLTFGCGPKEETGAGSKPSLNLEGKTLEQQIEIVQADPTIPPNYKETYIKSLRDKAAANGGKLPPQ